MSALSSLFERSPRVCRCGLTHTNCPPTNPGRFILDHPRGAEGDEGGGGEPAALAEAPRLRGLRGPARGRHPRQRVGDPPEDADASAYVLPNGARIWVLSEADRSATKLLLAEEYETHSPPPSRSNAVPNCHAGRARRAWDEAPGISSVNK